jgi:hypothetical protein
MGEYKTEMERMLESEKVWLFELALELDQEKELIPKW